MRIRHTTIFIGTVSNLDLETLKAQPGADLYNVLGSDVQEQIDMALLDHLHCLRTIVFIGGEEARREAQAYGVAWIQDTPAVNDELMEYWRTTSPECDSP